MQRRHFLAGIGGVTLGLPMLDAFMPRLARGAPNPAAPSPFVLIVVNANGVVQAGSAIGGSTDPEWFWPTTPGPLTTAGLTLDSGTPGSGREVGELAAYANKITIVRGVNHPFGAVGCAHAGGDAQLLTGARPQASGPKTLAGGMSIDTLIASKKNAPGGTVDPLTLHAGRYPPGGTGFDVPGYISYIGPSQPHSPQPSPFKAYMSMLGNGSATNVTPAAAQLIATRRKSVNDLVRSELQALIARPDLSSADQLRLQQHLQAVRDIEVQVTGKLSAAAVTAMQAVDAAPYDMTHHLAIIKMHMDLMVFAASTNFTKACTLKIGDREDDHEFPEDNGTTFHLITHRGVPNAVTKHDRVVRTHFQMFKGFLDSLAAVTTPTGPLLDQGLSIWTNQIANGNHSYVRVPWIIAGTANGYLKTGHYVDLPAVASTNKMLNTILTAAGVPSTAFGDAAAAGGVIAEMVV